MAFMLPLYDENRPSRRSYINYGLILSNIAVFFLQIFGYLGPFMGIRSYGAVPAHILRGSRIETLFTSMFMHGDIVHLAGNLIFLWVFGGNIEDSIGRMKYLLFYLLGGVCASFVHIASTLVSEMLLPSEYLGRYPFFISRLTIPSVGASGAISAVLGAYLLLYPRAKIRTLVLLIYIVTFTRIPAYYYLGFWFLYQLLMGFGSLLGLSSNVAFWAHIGGFAFGLATTKAIGIKPKKRPPLPSEMRPVTPVVAPWTVAPLVDILVEEDRVRILANIPGVEQKDIRIEVSEWAVTVSAEFRDIRFHRQVALPVPVIPKVQDPLYTNGVLSFTLRRLL